VALATLENGASIGFALVRTGESRPAGAIGEAALPRSNTVSRVLFDRETGAYFGYRVEVERREGARPFRVSFKSLDRPAVERELKQRGDCPGCPAPAPLGTGPQFPPAQQLAEGEALTLEAVEMRPYARLEGADEVRRDGIGRDQGSSVAARARSSVG
jgi:hypothetical protein